MQVYDHALTDVERYIDSKKNIRLDFYEPEFDYHMRRLQRFHPIDSDTRMLEVGIGTGWFPIMCKKKGLNCCGIEISPQLVAYARQFGRKYGIEPDVEVANIEESELEAGRYDVIIALSVFEHVENWRLGMRNIFDALKPGGVLYFHSTNKFSFKSGEYNFPLYGWLPNGLRYRLRTARQGVDIMKLGIDFHQFTYFHLRRYFRLLGFSRVLDKIDISDPDDLKNPTHAKKLLLRILHVLPPLKGAALFFSSGTTFICVK
jgi:SAM-dependent methyltransferase